MSTKLIWILVSGLLLGGTEARATFLPESEIKHVQPIAIEDAHLTESEFQAILSRIAAVYSPLVGAQGGKLSITGNWKEEKLNAAATQLFGIWKINVSGGLARRAELTNDGLTLIVCHEMGHHLGGFPIGADLPFIKPWAAVEGEADYFATQVCAKRLWAADKDNATFRPMATEWMHSRCDTSYGVTADQDLCYRTLFASKSVAETMAAIKGEAPPNFETPDPLVVTETSSKHPATQCRMDTSLQGTICPAAFDDHLIPGKNVAGGVSSIDAEKEAARTSCMKSSGYAYGLRPACWFKARL